MGLLSARIDAYKQQLAQLTAQQSHLEEVEQKVAQRVEQFRSQKEMVKAQYQAAQAQVNVNEAVTGISNEMTEMNLAMQRAQDKVLTMQARAGALDTLLEHGALGDQGLLGAPNSDIDQQLQQISAEHDVEAQLAALKQQMRTQELVTGLDTSLEECFYSPLTICNLRIALFLTKTSLHSDEETSKDHHACTK